MSADSYGTWKAGSRTVDWIPKGKLAEPKPPPTTDERFATDDGDYGLRMLRLKRQTQAAVRDLKEVNAWLSKAEARDLNCDGYSVATTPAVWGACMGKGHYLCRGCELLARSPTPEGE